MGWDSETWEPWGEVSQLYISVDLGEEMGLTYLCNMPLHAVAYHPPLP
jgi:hypothetical protein